MDFTTQVLEPQTVHLIKPGALLSPRRLDIAVKWRFFKSLQENDTDAERMYRWHIAQRQQSGLVDAEKLRGEHTLDFYVDAAIALFRSMEEAGFDLEHPIPVDPDMELLGGAHRLACALVLGEDVYIEPMAQNVWAPAWDLAWFGNAGLGEEDLHRVLSDWKSICSN